MDGERAVLYIVPVRVSRQHYVFVIGGTAMARAILRWEERDRCLIRLITDGEGQLERGRSRKRLQAAL